MPTKFILDPLKDDDKNILKRAIGVANRKPVYRNREALFLRNFILALFKQYKHHENYEKLDNRIKIERFNLPYFDIKKEKSIVTEKNSVKPLKVPDPLRIDRTRLEMYAKKRANESFGSIIPEDSKKLVNSEEKEGAAETILKIPLPKRIEIKETFKSSFGEIQDRILKKEDILIMGKNLPEKENNIVSLPSNTSLNQNQIELVPNLNKVPRPILLPVNFNPPKPLELISLEVPNPL